MFMLLMLTWSTREITTWLLVAGGGLLLIIIGYYALQFYLVKTKVDFVERETGINVPLLAPAHESNSKTSKAVALAKNPFVQKTAREVANNPKVRAKSKSILSNLQDKYLTTNKMDAPMRRADLNKMSTAELNTLYRSHVNANLSDATVIDRKRAINELTGLDDGTIANPHQNQESLSPVSKFAPTSEKVRLKRLTAVYEPLQAPVSKISSLKQKMHAPIVQWNNQGKGKGAVIGAYDTEGDISNQVIATTSFQVKEATAEQMKDESGKSEGMIINAVSKSNRKFTIVSLPGKLSAPFRKLRSPQVDYRNLGDKKGSVIKVHEDNTEVITQLPQQTKFVKAKKLDNSLIIDGKNKSGKRFTVLVKPLSAPFSLLRRNNSSTLNGPKWIQEATQQKNAYRKSVLDRYGSEGFDSNNNIRKEIIERDMKNTNNKIRKEAGLAHTLEQYHNN